MDSFNHRTPFTPAFSVQCLLNVVDSVVICAQQQSISFVHHSSLAFSWPLQLQLCSTRWQCVSTNRTDSWRKHERLPTLSLVKKKNRSMDKVWSHSEARQIFFFLNSFSHRLSFLQRFSVQPVHMLLRQNLITM